MSARDDILDLYKDWFGRTPDSAALNFWVQLMESGGESKRRIQQMMLATPEGQERIRARVGQLYRNELGRNPDEQGYEFWRQRAMAGADYDKWTTDFRRTALPEARRNDLARDGDTSTIDDLSQPIETPVQPPAPPTPIFDVEDASDADYSTLREMLRMYDLDGLYDTAVDLIASDADPATINIELRKTTEFQQRFPQIFAREREGKTAISPGEVIAYESQLESLMSYNGLPDDYGDVRGLANELMTGDVSLNQLNERLSAMRVFGRQVLDDPNQDRAAVEALLEQGATLYDVANFVLDPGKTLEQVERRLNAAAVANEAGQASYGLTPGEAMEQARLGMTAEQARQGFQALQAQTQVVDALGGEDDPVNRDLELAYARGEVRGQQAVERARRTRVNQFAEGGGFASDNEGFGGLR